MEEKIIYLAEEVNKRIDILQDEIKIVEYVKNRVKMKLIKYVIIGVGTLACTFAIEDANVKTVLIFVSMINGTFIIENGVDLFRKIIDVKKLKNKLKMFLRYLGE